MTGPRRKAFTLEEANALLPTLQAVLHEIERLHQTLEGHGERMQILDALWGQKVLAEENPDHGEMLEHREGAQLAAARIRSLIDHEILARGIRFPTGGLEHGLLDFPTTLDGRWVYLCWRRGEESVSQWHEVDGGFAGRRAVGPAEAARMGMGDDFDAIDDSALDF